VNCKEPLIVGAGKNAERYLRPENVQFSNNKIVASGEVIRWADDSAQIRFENNIVYASTKDEQLPAGFSILSPVSIKKDATGIYLIPSSSPLPRFWEVETVGPAWMPQKKFAIK
jgi:hypothetical protein